MYGVFAPVITQLAEKHGEPYKSFPVNMMRYGVGRILANVSQIVSELGVNYGRNVQNR